MSYLVLARKYRPQTFTEITGQEHVTRTLTNAIEQDRVHHAFLFCGARGVGKTTAARVLAKALNCDNGPTPNPCGTCTACVEISAARSIDVYEIDGASNRGIGEIRELREGVAYAPQRDRFKIYIIDEVHMLTTEAFNALLKTLEEPPSHVKFIFATTEPHKIPVTILSRCQRFDFKRIPLGVMVTRLEEILTSEEVSIDSASLRLVARESEGSMRDALSLVDRIISFAGAKADFEQVTGILGVADRGWLREIVEAALARNAQQGLKVVQEVFNYGMDIKQFARDLVHYLRDIIMLRVAGADTSLTDLSDEETKTLAQIGQSQQIADLQRLFAVITATAEKLAQASFPRLELEMAVIRMCEIRPLVPIDGLVQRLEALERHLESGAPLPPPSAPVIPRGSGGPAPPSSPSPASSPPVESGGGPVALAERTAPVTLHVVPDPPIKVEQAVPPAKLHEAAPQVKAVPAQVEESLPPHDESLPDLSFSNDEWEAFVDLVSKQNARLAATLARGQVLGVSRRTVRVGFTRGSQSAASARHHGNVITGLLSKTNGGRVDFVVEEVEKVEDCPFSRREARHQATLDRRRQTVEKHPTIVDVVQRFDGKLRHIDVYDEREQQQR